MDKIIFSTILQLPEADQQHILIDVETKFKIYTYFEPFIF